MPLEIRRKSADQGPVAEEFFEPVSRNTQCEDDRSDSGPHDFLSPSQPLDFRISARALRSFSAV